MSTIIKLILVHIVFDFILQSKKQVKEKEKNKLKSIWTYIHPVLHGVFSLLIVWSLNFWWYAILIAVSHFTIDTIKIYIQNRHNDRQKFWTFIADQIIHFVIIAIISIKYDNLKLSLDTLISEQVLVFIVCLVSITKPCSVIVKMFISSFNFEKKSDKDKDSLDTAGMWIGILERILVFIFIIGGWWSAIGFLFAAKSVFRFGDLSKENQRVKTEYVLLGSLMSFLLVIMIGLIYMTY